jgi:hypothetical protein
MDPAGMPYSCGSTGPSTALGSIMISSAARAIKVPPDISPEDEKTLKKLGLKAEPFKEVKFYVPPYEGNPTVPDAERQDEKIVPFFWSIGGFAEEGLIRFMFVEEEESKSQVPYLMERVANKLYYLAKNSKEGWSLIKDVILDIAERGRSLGVILIGAQQTASEIEKRILANSAIKVVGRMDSSKLLSKEYEFLVGNFRQRALMLKKGTMILYQPDIPSPLMLKFPKPPWATRRQEVEEENLCS